MSFGNKKNLFILVLLLATLFIFAPDITFAQADPLSLSASTTPTGEALVTNPFDPTGTLIYRALSGIGGLVAWLGGTFLNVSLSLFVFNLPHTATSLGLMDISSYVWQFTRDLFNLLFIFGLTLIGFKFILGLDVTGAKRNLGTILIAALLINFSLYATQLIIDVGNIAANEIGDLFTPAEGSPTQTLFGIDVIDVSSSFVANTDITNIGNQTLSLSSYAATGEENDTGTGRELGVADALGMGLTIAVLLTLIGFVFAAGAFLMLARFFYLLFLMMFSPIMFLGFVLPKMQNISSDWWKRLISQTIMGPAYLFMLLIALRALETLMKARGDGEMNTISFMVSSILVAGFVWSSLVVAKKMGALGASASMNFVGNSFAGGAAGLLRGTVGRGFYKAAESDRLRDAASKKGIGGWAARRTLNLSTKVSDSSFDARNVAGVGERIGAGAGMKGGYVTATKQIADREKAFAEKLGTVSDDDEKVSSLKLEIEAHEQALKDKKKSIQEARRSLSETTDEEERRAIRARIESDRAEVENIEEEKNKASENLSAERYRRQVGSKSSISADTLKEVKDKKTGLETNLKNYAANQAILRDPSETQARKDAATAAMATSQQYIADAKKELADIEKRAAKEAGGYASIVESRGEFKSFITGLRDKSQNQNAGNEVRKNYKNKVKSKD